MCIQASALSNKLHSCTRLYTLDPSWGLAAEIQNVNPHDLPKMVLSHGLHTFGTCTLERAVSKSKETWRGREIVNYFDCSFTSTTTSSNPKPNMEDHKKGMWNERTGSCNYSVGPPLHAPRTLHPDFCCRSVHVEVRRWAEADIATLGDHL